MSREPVSDERPPNREIDEPKFGQLAGTPSNLIRRPIELPPMERIQSASPPISAKDARAAEL